MKLYILAILAFFSKGAIQSVYAQTSFLDGYIIGLEGDTSYGYIDYQEWVKTPNTIVFKYDTLGIESVFSSNDILEFYVSGERYKSETVTVDLAHQKVQSQNLRITGAPIFQEERVFLRELAKSESLSLYMYVDNRVHFYANRDEGYLELISNEFVERRNGRLKVNSANRYAYANQLQSIVPSCAFIIDKKMPSYTAKSLINFVSDCNSFLGYSTHSNFKIEKKIIKHGIVLGTGINTFNVDFRHGLAKFVSDKYFSIGYSADFILPRANGTRIMSYQLIYSYLEAANKPYSQYYTVKEVKPSGGYRYISLHDRLENGKARMGHLSLYLSYSQKLTDIKFTPNFIIGGSISKYLHSSKSGAIVREYNVNKNSTKPPSRVDTLDGELFKPVDISANWHIGIGLIRDKYAVSLLSEPNPNLFGKNFITNSGIYLRAKYTFGK